MTFGDISLNGHMAVFYLGDEDLPKYLYVVNATRVEKGQFSLRADRNVTLYLERMRDGEYLLENQGQQAANVRIKGEPWEGVTAQKLDAQGKILGQTNTVTESNFLRVTVASESRYKLSSIFIND